MFVSCAIHIEEDCADFLLDKLVLYASAVSNADGVTPEKSATRAKTSWLQTTAASTSRAQSIEVAEIENGRN
jgi:hypothetical protein